MHILANSAGNPTPLKPSRGGLLTNPQVAQSRAQPTWDDFVRRSESILSGKR